MRPDCGDFLVLPHYSHILIVNSHYAVTNESAYSFGNRKEPILLIILPSTFFKESTIITLVGVSGTD